MTVILIIQFKVPQSYLLLPAIIGLIVSTASIFMIIILTVEVSLDTAFKWIVSYYFLVLSDLLVLQPLYWLVTLMIHRRKVKISNSGKDIMPMISSNNEPIDTPKDDADQRPKELELIEIPSDGSRRKLIKKGKKKGKKKAKKKIIDNNKVIPLA